MKNRRTLVIAAATFSLFFFTLAFVGIFSLKNENNSDSIKSIQKTEIDEKATSTPLVQSAEQLPSSDYTQQLNVELSTKLGIPQTTLEEMVANGLPAMSNGRKMKVLPVLHLTTEETAADIGNVLTYSSIFLQHGSGYFYNEISGWAIGITSHTNVLRLIEEAQSNTELIQNLLDNQIQEIINKFPKSKENFTEENRLVSSGEKYSPSISESDAHYAGKREYKNAIFEFERIHISAYSSFYILASIGKLNNAKALDSWISVSESSAYSCEDLNLWLIDAYARTQKLSSPEYFQSHHQITSDKFKPKTVVRSKWNAPVDIHNPFAAAMNIDLKDIPTIEVLEIPSQIDLTSSEKNAIIQAFRHHVQSTEIQPDS